MGIFAPAVVGALLCLVLAGTVSGALAAPRVIASIVPVHALVSSVMDGIGTPELLLSGQTSEHQQSFSPAQIKALGDADAVFFIGEGLELKLEELSGSDAVKGRKFIELAEIKDLTKLGIREGGAWESHHHDVGEHAEGELEPGIAEHDPHIWLDPRNARLMLGEIARNLAKADPRNAKSYVANAAKASADLDVLEFELAETLEPVAQIPFVVFHDAFQYFEFRFDLTAAGSISDVNANAPSAKRLAEVRNKLKDAKAVCAFREPQFSDAAVKTLVEGTGARVGVLDPIGADLTPGKGAYRALLENLTSNLISCLGR